MRAFTIRQLQRGDVLLAAYRDLRIQLWPDCAEECDCEIAEIFDDPNRWAVFLVCPEGQDAVGFLEVHLRDYAEGTDSSPVAFIEGWFIVPNRRRRGLGKALVGAAEQWAVAQGCREIASDTETDNAVSVAAHKRLGYREVERLVCFLKELTRS